MLDLLDAIIGDGIEGDGSLPEADELAARYASDRESAVRAIEGLTLRGLAEADAEATRILPPDRWQLLDRDIAEAVLHFASGARSGKSTGNLLNVDGGVPAAFTR